MADKYNSPQEEALELALSTRLKIIEPNPDILSIVRACFVIANNLSKGEDLDWIEGELNGWPCSEDCPEYRAISLPLKYASRGSFENKKVRFSIEKLKHYIDRNEGIILYFEDDENRYNLRPDHCIEIMGLVLNKCLKFLTACILELHYSGKIQSIFEEIKKEVDLKIINLGEGINQELQSIYLNLISKNPVDKSKVADSCRRILKIVADKVFPPKIGAHLLKNGVELEVKDNQFLNRLICFFDEKDSKLTSSECLYLSNLNEEVQDDVHKEEISQEEASNIALHTYLVLYEALKYI